MRCPVCRAEYRSGAVLCRRCGLDWSPLLAVLDQALAYHRRALAAFEGGDYALAAEANDQALNLTQDQDSFHQLRGQLLFLAGDFSGAAQAWRRALRLAPDGEAQRLLQGLQELLLAVAGDVSLNPTIGSQAPL
ncbi:MAG: tetratricopeptide repeat protein [Cyanobacteria bacterium RI_101]|nr:tetratricopeptide repeat protein [Cyanobacteria bacterium RI_101]